MTLTETVQAAVKTEVRRTAVAAKLAADATDPARVDYWKRQAHIHRVAANRVRNIFLASSPTT